MTFRTGESILENYLRSLVVILKGPHDFDTLILFINFVISSSVHSSRRIELKFEVPRYSWKDFLDWGILSSIDEPMPV